jgi:hypothetical protein
MADFANDPIVLFSNQGSAATSPSAAVAGGDYGWSILGTVGTSVQLQTLGADGATWVNYLAARTTNDGAATPAGATLATFSAGSRVRAVVTGSPSGLYVTLNRIPAGNG